MSLLQKPVEELAPLLQTKQVSPLELVRECLDRIKKTEPLVNAYISVLDESALKAAREAEESGVSASSPSTTRCSPTSAASACSTSAPIHWVASYPSSHGHGGRPTATHAAADA